MREGILKLPPINHKYIVDNLTSSDHKIFLFKRVIACIKHYVLDDINICANS